MSPDALGLPTSLIVNPYQAFQGVQDVFVSKLSNAGNNLIYSTYLGGSNDEDWGIDIALDAYGFAYITGRTYSTDFPTVNPYQTDQGESDVFVTKLSSAGNSLIYSTYLGGSYDDHGMDIDVDASGCAYVTGWTSSTDLPTVNPYQATYQGSGGDVFITKLSSAGNSLIYSTYLGGSDADAGWSIALDASGFAYVTGWTSSTDFPTVNPYQTYQGNCDVFMVKFSDEQVPLFVSPLDPNPNPVISSVMQGGTVYRYYQVVDDQSQPQSNISVGIQFNSQQMTFYSDDNGIVKIEIQEEDLDTNPGQSVNVAIITVGGQPIDPTEQISFDIVIEPRKFEKSWDVLTYLTVEGGLQAGIGIGPLGARAAQVSVKGEGGIGMNLKLLKGEDPNDALIIGRRIDLAGGGELSVGKISLLGAEQRVGGKASALIRVVAEQEFAFNDPFNDLEQMKVEAAIVLETLNQAHIPSTPIVGPIMQLLINLIVNSPGTQQLVADACDKEGLSLGIEGEVQAGFETKLFNQSLTNLMDFSLPNGEANISFMGGANQFKHSIYFDQNPDVEKEAYFKSAYSFSGALLEIIIDPILTPGIEIDLTNVLPHYELNFGGGHEQKVYFDNNWNLLKGSISLSADDKIPSTIGEQHVFENLTVEFDEDILSMMLAIDGLNIIRMAFFPNLALLIDPPALIDDFSQTVAYAINIIHDNPNKKVNYTKEIEKISIYDFSIDLDLNLALGAGILVDLGMGITGTDCKKYISEKGVFCNSDNYQFIHETYSDDAYTQVDNGTLETVLTNVLVGVIPLIQDALEDYMELFEEIIDNLQQTIAQTGQDIIDGGAQLVVDAGIFVDNAIAQIVKFDPGWPLYKNGQITKIPYSCYKRQIQVNDKGLDIDTTTIIVTGVGQSYQVNILNPDSTIITEYPEPLDFKIVITDSDLAESGFGPEYRPNLKIFRWNTDSSQMVPLPSSLSDDTVICQITSGGQYLAGISGLPPDTTAPSYNYITPEPNDSLYVWQLFEIELLDSEFCSQGLNSWSIVFAVDSDTLPVGLLIPDQYHIYLSCIPKIDSLWPLGEHTAFIEFEDNAGNQSSVVIPFVVKAALCGDANSDGTVNVSDAVYIINYVFVGGNPPDPIESGDCNCDGVCNVSDAVFIINYVFVGGNEPCDTDGDGVPDC